MHHVELAKRFADRVIGMTGGTWSTTARRRSSTDGI